MNQNIESYKPILWDDVNGRKYKFHILPLDFVFDPKDEGNYIFAKLTNPSTEYYDAVYIGEGNLNDRTKAHIREGCVTAKGATHIHAHLNADEDARKSEESGLLAKHTEAYVPLGCNIKIGG